MITTTRPRHPYKEKVETKDEYVEISRVGGFGIYLVKGYTKTEYFPQGVCECGFKEEVQVHSPVAYFDQAPDESL